MSLRSKLLDLLRVPRRPSAPEGDENVQVLRAAPNYFWYRVLHWFMRNAVGLVGLFMAVGFFSQAVPRILPEQFEFGVLFGLVSISRRTVLMLFRLLEMGAVAGFAAQALGTLLLLRLDFEQRWYVVSDRSLRIREGLIRMREQTVTFANVQHVSIRQGPLQRLLGIADLQVRSAGGKGGDSEHTADAADLHVAHLRGIADPEHVRNAIRERLRLHRDAGLGDPDDVPQRNVPDLLAPALELAQEARLLRLALQEQH